MKKKNYTKLRRKVKSKLITKKILRILRKGMENVGTPIAKAKGLI